MDKKQYLIIGFGLLIYIIILKYMFSLLFPFILAILCFFVLKPLIDRIQQYIPLQKSAIGISYLSCFSIPFGHINNSFILFMCPLFSTIACVL